MNRKPDETVEQWHARAATRYQQALDALDVESRRPGLDDWRFPAGTCPMLDETYLRALDDMVAADDERTDAFNAAQRESSSCLAVPRIGPARAAPRLGPPGDVGRACWWIRGRFAVLLRGTFRGRWPLVTPCFDLRRRALGPFVAIEAR